MLASFAGSAVNPEWDYSDLVSPAHQYYRRELKDPFTRLKTDLESGRIALDRSSEQAFLVSLLQALDIPVSSQMLVFSTTSLQLSLITPSNPRALYFNEELYVGYIPGGKIEIISTDPELGAVFYIFDIPRNDGPIAIERSRRCMNCHSGAETGRVPGPRGGSLDAFRLEEMGHGIPLDQRFGGWYLTGAADFTNHWANVIGRLSPEGLSRRLIVPGKEFSFDKYPFGSSDLLPQLLHEHQAGFVNRVVEATYRVRATLHDGEGQLSPAGKALVEAQAARIVRYVLFQGEAPLPPKGVEGDPRFLVDFRRNARATSAGSLKDFDLKTRLFRYRCSYMIYTGLFGGMPGPLKAEVCAQMGKALSPEADAEFNYLPAEEKEAIRAILRETVPDLAKGW